MVIVLLLWIGGIASCVKAAEPSKTPRALIQYIEDAKRLGLKENDIRQNAITAGWNKDLVSEAFAIVRYLETSAAATPKSTPSASGPLKTTQESAGYRIGPGDVLQILVWKEPDASVAGVVVRTDGRISLPLIKELEVAGLTPSELEKVLVEKFAKYIRGADVTVVPKEIVLQKVYLMGAVKKEGPVALQSSMTVLQALNAAGGLTEYAKRKKIYVLRTENGKQTKLPFDYQAVIRGEAADQNFLVKPEDTIVVP
ncbi:MAG TPA: polysaccharide biosynthesis/export family protein [Bryobacteraceae bacterium]|nr:polysaccharide biosynthesis/export family protein [Bryobacteraceae bacterium]